MVDTNFIGSCTAKIKDLRGLSYSDHLVKWLFLIPPFGSLRVND